LFGDKLGELSALPDLLLNLRRKRLATGRIEREEDGIKKEEGREVGKRKKEGREGGTCSIALREMNAPNR